MDPEQRQQMRERIQRMSPQEREQFFARMRERGGPGGPGMGRGRGGDPREGSARRRMANAATASTVPTVDRGATTIDALFSPLPPTVSNGRLWLLENGRLRSVNVRLGVTDGTASELLGVRAAQPTPVSGARPSSVAWVDSLRQPAEAGGDVAGFDRPVPEGGRALTVGAQLVTNVTTPEVEASSPGGGGSPLIPTFGRRRR